MIGDRYRYRWHRARAKDSAIICWFCSNPYQGPAWNQDPRMQMKSCTFIAITEGLRSLLLPPKDRIAFQGREAGIRSWDEVSNPGIPWYYKGIAASMVTIRPSTHFESSFDSRHRQNLNKWFSNCLEKGHAWKNALNILLWSHNCHASMQNTWNFQTGCTCSV